MSDKPFGRQCRFSLLASISAAVSILLLSGAVYAQPVNDDCDSATVIPGSAPFPPETDRGSVPVLQLPRG